MNKSKYSFVISMIAIIMFLTGCISEEERAQAEAWRAQAEKNAVSYIEGKYGFKATVLDSETQKTESLFSAQFTSKTLVTMEYNGKQFRVLAFGEDGYMDETTDNYQKAELLAAVEEEVTTLFGVAPDVFEVAGGDNEYATTVNSDEFYDMYYHTYYDGTNLEEVLAEEIFYCLAEYVGDIDLDNLYEQNKTPLFEHKYVHAGFLTYDSQENMEISDIDIDVGFDSEVYKYALYVKDALAVEEGEATPIELSIGECGDFCYMNVDTDISQYSITESSEKYASDEWNGHGFRNAAFAMGTAYYLEGNRGYKLYIYIPTEIYEQIPSGEFDENVVVASRFLSENKENISYDLWLNHETIPGYEVFWTAYADMEDFSFRFMYDAEESE